MKKFSRSYDDNSLTIEFPNGDTGFINSFNGYSVFSYNDGGLWELHSGVTKTMSEAETLLLCLAEEYGAFSSEVW